jgi:acetyltransferase-like isoleucine patch superfamily enzyme
MRADRIEQLFAVNLLAELRLARRVQHRKRFVCRGRIQLSLAKDAAIATPSRACYIGVPLFGDATPKQALTILACASQSTLTIDGGVCIGQGVTLSVAAQAQLRVGQDSYIAGDSRVLASCSTQIGRRCAISFGVTILEDDGHGFGLPPYSAPICIEDDVWIGCNVTILKGVTIGKGSVVAAGAVVTRSCPPHSLLAGVPARVIREGVLWTDANRLQEQTWELTR